MKVLGWILLVGLILAYWKFVVVLLVLWAVVKAAPVAYRELQQERAVRRQRAAEIVARADRQRVWWESGDPRWLTGA